MRKADFARFTEALLGLGQLVPHPAPIDCLAAVLDLQGFTLFCNQRSPELTVPEFLGEFLHWMFSFMRRQATALPYWEVDSTNVGEVVVLPSLPFFAKFMGDGVIFLWNMKFCHGAEDEVVESLRRLCEAYRDEFWPLIRRKVDKPPERLRCGIARSQIVPIGKSDFVGPCINLAARLQKLPGVTFAVARRGFKSSDGKGGEPLGSRFVARRAPIRGIGEELVLLLESEFEKLSEKDRSFYA